MRKFLSVNTRKTEEITTAKIKEDVTAPTDFLPIHQSEDFQGARILDG
jgi:hypothetical protein